MTTAAAKGVIAKVYAKRNGVGRRTYLIRYRAEAGESETTPASKAVSAVVRRQSDLGTPETCLLFAVLDQAISDFLNPGSGCTRHYKRDALRFLFTSRVDPVAHSLGLESEFVRRMVIEASPRRLARFLSGMAEQEGRA